MASQVWRLENLEMPRAGKSRAPECASLKSESQLSKSGACICLSQWFGQWYCCDLFITKPTMPGSQVVVCSISVRALS